jgi:hypothetical protein
MEPLPCPEACRTRVLCATKCWSGVCVGRVEVSNVIGNDAGTAFGAEQPLTAAESLALIEAQRAEVDHRLGGNPALLLALWGLAYLLGFGLIYLTYGADPLVSAPEWVAATSTALLFVAAIGVSAVYGVRAGRGVHGPSQMVGAMYGWSWTLGFLALVAVNVGLSRLGLSQDAVSLLWSGSSLVLVGVLYLAGGALWRDRFQYGLGVWMLVTGAGSVFAGVPGNFAVLSLASGGGLLVTAGYFTLRRRRGPRK